MYEVFYLNKRIVIKSGDITHEKCSVVVNAANSTLLGGGGVDGAIHRAGGVEILRECQKIRKDVFPDGLPTGYAVMTTGGNLPASHVIHTVGPVWKGGDSGEPEALSMCYFNSLKIASDNQFTSIAFPAISTGVYGYPRDKAAAIASKTVKKYILRKEFPVTVIFVFFSETDKQIFVQHQLFED
ncbi:MAG: O-acetyl-ADP-ribose deacetylase [Spirochaetia bacterium]|nr:O-acetyl-ADP-ribose deacetylase [Spirochaetia bacterium]